MRQSFVPRQRGAVVLLTSMLLATTATGALANSFHDTSGTDTTSIKTIDPRLDTHAKSEDFFNVAKYPTMTFKSTSFTFDGDRVVGIDGELTLLGVTKPVALKVSNDICGEHPINKRPMCGAEAVTTIKRSEWGMKYGIPRAVSDEVKITIPIEAYKEQ